MNSVPDPITASAAPDVSVVIPSYNRKENVLTLLADLDFQQGVSFEVIVVDDASLDGSPDAIAEAFPHVMLLRNETNGGPCVARNRGIRAARGEIIVGFDSDVTIPDTTLLRRIYETLVQLPEVTALALRILASDGRTDDGPR